MDNVAKELVSELTASQSRLQGYIFTLTADREATQDILQATNLVIWDKADQYVSGTNFIAWAFQIARFQVLAYRKNQKRSKLVFSEELVEELADASSVGMHDDEYLTRQNALRKCLEGITADQRQLLLLRYRNGLKMRDIAAQVGKATSAVEKSIARMRASLLRCIESRMAEEAAS